MMSAVAASDLTCGATPFSKGVDGEICGFPAVAFIRSIGVNNVYKQVTHRVVVAFSRCETGRFGL